MSHDAVEEAVVISADHEKWQERPVAYIVPDDDPTTEDDLREHLLERFLKWWLPERFLFVDDMPRTTTGEFNKMRLRESFAEEFGTIPIEE